MTDRAVADERETIALMCAGERRGAAPIRARAVDKALRVGPLTGERVAAFEAVEPERAKGRDGEMDGNRSADRGIGESVCRDWDRSSGPELEPGRGGRGVDRDLEL